jgi:putative CocE/NonD family hydrolase
MNSSGKVERKITRREFVKKTASGGVAALAFGAGGIALPISAKENQIHSILIDQNVPIKMRDGVKLVGDVYRPGNPGKYSAILVRTPYHINEVFNFSYVQARSTVMAGYALVISYWRGRYGSEGKYDVAASQDVEGADCYDTVEWVASQPWCDGNIGMAGESGLGTVQWRTARENPPHLKAIAPSLAGAPGERRPEISDSPALLNVAVSFTLLVAGDVLDKLEANGEDTTEMRRLIKEVDDDPSLAYNYLPLKDVPQFNIPGVREIWHSVLGISASKKRSIKPEPYPFHKVTIPTLHIASWYDPWARLTFDTFFNMKEKAGSVYSREHQHVFAGPWCHHRPTRILGDIDFGHFADELGSRAWEYQLSFFDKYLKGKDVSLPVIRYFTMGKNVWNESSAWPLPETDWQRFFLHSHGGANSCNGNGLLSREEPGSEPTDTYVYNPFRPVPTVGGKGADAENGFVTGPIDQGRVEHRADVLCYTTTELDQDMEVTGPLKLHLYASSSCKDTDFVAKLVDVYPDGRAYNIADGITRARYRNSFYEPELLTPGEIVEFIIWLGPVSQLFRHGHRIRIDVTSSNFPTYDRNMNTGDPIGVNAEGIPALQTIYHQTGYASFMDFPVIPA